MGRAGVPLVHPQCPAHAVLAAEHTSSRRHCPPGGYGPISPVNLPVPTAGLRASHLASCWFYLSREHPHFTHHLDSASTFCHVGSIQYLPKTSIHPSILFLCIHFKVRVSLVAHTAKNLPALTQVQSPGQEDALEKGMSTNSSILAWRLL